MPIKSNSSFAVRDYYLVIIRCCLPDPPITCIKSETESGRLRTRAGCSAFVVLALFLYLFKEPLLKLIFHSVRYIGQAVLAHAVQARHLPVKPPFVRPVEQFEYIVKRNHRPESAAALAVIDFFRLRRFRRCPLDGSLVTYTIRRAPSPR